MAAQNGFIKMLLVHCFKWVYLLQLSNVVQLQLWQLSITSFLLTRFDGSTAFRYSMQIVKYHLEYQLFPFIIQSNCHFVSELVILATAYALVHGIPYK